MGPLQVPCNNVAGGNDFSSISSHGFRTVIILDDIKVPPLCIEIHFQSKDDLIHYFVSMNRLHVSSFSSFKHIIGILVISNPML